MKNFHKLNWGGIILTLSFFCISGNFLGNGITSNFRTFLIAEMPDSTNITQPEWPDSTDIPQPEWPDSTDIPQPEWPDSTDIPQPEWPDSTDVPQPEWPDSTDVPQPEWPDSTDVPQPEWPDSTDIPQPEWPDSTDVPQPEWPDSTDIPQPEWPDSTDIPQPEWPDSISIANTPATAYTVAEAHRLIEAGKELDTEVYIKGIITQIDEVNLTYGNADYYISGNDTVGGPLQVYRGYYFDGSKFTAENQIQVGDEVVVYGLLSSYDGKHEITTGSVIYSLNGSTEPPTPTVDISNTPETAYTVAEAHRLIEADEGLETEVYIKGIIVQIDEINKNFGNATYHISGMDSVSEPLQIYQGRFLEETRFTEEDQIQVGDEVVVYGQLSDYKGKHQVNSGNSIYSLNGETEPPAPTVDISNTPETAYTVAEAHGLIEADEGLSAKVYIKGIITQIDEVSTDFGNATYYISGTDTVGGPLQVYRGYYFDELRFTKQDQIQVGDEVVVYGQLLSFFGQHQVVEGNSIYSLNGETEPPASSVDISNTIETAYTVAEAHELIEAGEDLETQVYIKGIITQIDEVNLTYGNADYYISGTDTVGGPLQVYRGYYFDGTKFTSEDQIQVGDEVVIYGKLSTYEGRHQLAMGNMICSLKDGNGTVGTDRIKAECQTLTDVYSLSGIRVRSQVSVSEATKGLSKGIYIVNGKKVIVR